jgi:hypothetical protein
LTPHRSGHTKLALASQSGSSAQESWRVARNVIPGVRPNTVQWVLIEMWSA